MDKIVELSENIEHYMRATTTKGRKVEPAEVNKVKLMMELCKLRNAEKYVGITPAGMKQKQDAEYVKGVVLLAIATALVV